jgi:hypothetical protein
MGGPDTTPQPADLMTDDLVHYVAGFLSPSDLQAAMYVLLRPAAGLFSD